MRFLEKDKMGHLTVSMVLGLSIWLPAFLFSGCKTTYVPVETVKTRYIDREKRDSVHIFDSIYVREKPGTRIDTLEITRWRTEYRDRLRIDSIFICDSIQVPFPVEKQLSRWQSVKMDLGGLAIGGFIAMVVFAVFLLIKRVKR